MEEKRRIEQKLADLKSLQLLAQAHEEISTTHIRLARGMVLMTRDFLASLSEVFVNVKSAYKKHVLAEIEKSKQTGKPLPVISSNKNGKTLFVFLSANNKLYGDIISRTFVLFQKELEKQNPDIVIVGRLGKELYDVSGLKKPYVYFEIPDTHKNIKDITRLTTYILPYEQLKLFYVKFINVVSQVPASASLTGEESLEVHVQSVQKTKEYDFIFEPSIEKVMDFFTSQTFFSLLNQTIHEAELARYGSRIKAMEDALGNITSQMQIVTLAERRIKNLQTNKKQLERIAGMSLWR